MSGDDYKFQASLKYGPGGSGMLNVRANSREEFVAAVNEAVDSIGPLAVLTEAFNTEFASVSAVASAFPTAMVVNQQPAQQGGTPNCGPNGSHGAMQYREAPDGSWKGHFCPLQKGDVNKCKPRYIR